MGTRESFDLVRAAFHARAGQWAGGPFFVPGHLHGHAPRHMIDVGDPYRYFAALFDDLAGTSAPPRTGPLELIYWWHPRVQATLNGRSGTVIAQVAFLHHFVDLGVSDLVLLPSAPVGHTNRKGNNGSPFAVSNPFDVDECLADPLLAGVPALDQYRAFIHCCHLLGLRVASHVPLATLAIDSPLFRLFPQLGYWWTMPSGVPLVPDAPVGASTCPPQAPTLPEWASSRFREPPGAVEVAGGRLVGVIAGDIVTLANAVPDVVAGDEATYTWADSAAVRYGDALVPPQMGVTQSSATMQPEAVALMAATLAFRWADLGEDGAVIDVSPNVPDPVLAAAEKLAANWNTSVSATARSVLRGSKPPQALALLLAATLAGSRPPGKHWLLAEELWRTNVPDKPYDAVTGPFAYSVGALARNPISAIDALLSLIGACTRGGAETSMTAAVALHDTFPPPTAVGIVLTAVAAALPGAVPTVYAGAEHGFSQLTNAEFGFSDHARLSGYRSWVGVTGLSLFEAHVDDWTAADTDAFDVYQRLLPALVKLRREIAPSSVCAVERLEGACLLFTVVGAGGHLNVVVNLDSTRWCSAAFAGASRTLVVAGRCLDGCRQTPVFEEHQGSGPGQVAPVSAHVVISLDEAAREPRTPS